MDNKVEVRKSNGQFGPGNQTGGRKPRTAEDARELFRRAVSSKDQMDIIEKAIQLAKKGDDKSRKFIFDYLYGPPVERKEITGADNKPLEIRVVYDNNDYEGEDN